jgi:DNA-binding FadR family transcriptional regulator
MVKKSERRLGTTEIAGILRREISQGILMAKERLPSERSLADTHGVARGTVRQALNLLAREGLVQIRRSSGAYVTFNAFHTLLVETTGNRLLIWIVSQINSVRNQEQWFRMRLLTLNASTISQYNVQHRDILNAIRAREPERAAMHMKQHLETARLSLTRGAST